MLLATPPAVDDVFLGPDADALEEAAFFNATSPKGLLALDFDVESEELEDGDVDSVDVPVFRSPFWALEE
jgi:hypothetical protein